MTMDSDVLPGHHQVEPPTAGRSEPVSNSVIMPTDGASRVREALGMSPDAPLRVAFVAGPGDAVGTFDHWSQGIHDPRMPVINYTTMLYSLVEALDAEALILVEQDRQPAQPRGRFRFEYTPRRRGRGGIGYHLDERAFALKVLRHLRAYRPDVIIVGTDAPDALIARLPRTRRVVLTAHNTYWPMGRRPNSLKARARSWIWKQGMRRIDVAVCTSDECAAQIAELGGPSGARSFTEIPQILTEFYPPQLAPAAAVETLLYVGRIEASKGVFDLLQAFESVAAEHATLRLEIAGTGTAAAPLMDAIAASPHADRIVFHGQLLAKAVHQRLESADLLLCPTRSSFSEGLALVVVEAAVHGVPTLLSSIVPAKALFPGASEEFPADDTAALTATLRRLVSSPADYATLCTALAEQRAQFRDRSKSWGSMLYRALVA